MKTTQLALTRHQPHMHIKTNAHDKTRPLVDGPSFIDSIPEGWTSSEDAFWIFREFPTPVAQYSNAVTQRIVAILLVGFGCWCLVGLLKVTSVYDFARADFSQKQNRNGKTLTKILVAIVTICMSIIAGLSLIVLLVDVSGTPL